MHRTSGIDSFTPDYLLKGTTRNYCFQFHIRGCFGGVLHWITCSYLGLGGFTSNYILQGILGDFNA